jgi:hypothetical protein
MDYIQTLFGFFDAPLFATFILGTFWSRMTRAAGWIGLVTGTVSAILVAFLNEDAFGSASLGVIPLGGQGAAFVAASTAFVVDIVVSVAVSLVTAPKAREDLVGLMYSETPKEQRTDPEEQRAPWYRRTVPLAGVALAMVVVLNIVVREGETMAEKHTAGAFDIRNIIGLLAVYGVVLTLMGLFADPETDKTGGVNANLWAGLALLVVGLGSVAWSRPRPVTVPDDVEPPADDPTRPAPRKRRRGEPRGGR